MKQDRFEVLLENILSKVEIIAEGHGLLNHKIDRVEANLLEKITANSEKIDHLANTLSETRQELSETRQDVAGIQQELSGTRQDVAGIQQELSGTRRDVAGIQQELSGTRQELNEKIDRVAANLEAHRADTERHRGYVVAEHPLPPE